MADHRLGNASKTVLAFGAVKAPVSLYKTVKELKDTDSWDTAGPHGGELHLESRAFEAPERKAPEPVDPLATDDDGPVPDADGVLDAADVTWPTATEDNAFTRLAADQVVTDDPPNPGGIAGGVLDGSYDPGGPPTREELEAAQDGTGPALHVTADADGTSWERVPQEPEPARGEFRQVLVEEDSGEVVERADVRRGVRLDDGTFVDLTEHLDRADEDAKMDVMRVVSFIRVEQVRRERVKGSYYLATDGADSRLPLSILYAAMRVTRRVAVVKWSKTKKQTLGVVVPDGRTGAILVLEMAWERAWVDPTPRVLEHTKVDPPREMVAAAVELIGAMADSVASLDELEDDAWATKRDLRAYAEEHGKPPKLEEREPEGSDADLAALLSFSAAKVRTS